MRISDVSSVVCSFDLGEAGGEEDSHDQGYSFIWNEKLAAEAAPANAREPVGAASAASFLATGGHGATITVIASTCRTHRAGRTSSGTTSRSGPASSSSALPSPRSTRTEERWPRGGSNAVHGQASCRERVCPYV